MSKATERARAKAHRITRTDPQGTKVDASGYTPPDALDADVKTGMRPISRRQFKKGGKVVGAVHGEHAKRHAGRKPRKSGGKALSADSLINRNAKEANAERDGSKHVGGFKHGGATHPDEREDRALVKKMVKGEALTGKKHGGRAHKYDGGEAMGTGAGDKPYLAPASQKPDPAALAAIIKAGGGKQRPRETYPDLDTRPDPNDPNALWTGQPRKRGGKAEHGPGCRCHECHGGVAKKRGGSLSVSDGALEGTRPTGGRMARKDGGRTKGKTNINIIIGTGKGMDNQMGGGQPPTMPPRPPAMPVAVPPPPGAGAPMGMPPGGMPPMMPPGAGAPPPGGMPPMMGRKTGGRVAEAKMEFGAGGGKGRLEKIKEYGHRK